MTFAYVIDIYKHSRGVKRKYSEAFPI